MEQSHTDASANRARVESFDTAFQRKDAAAMTLHYAPDVVFSDPVFPVLKGTEVSAMWAMLLGSAKDFHVSYEILGTAQDVARVRWVARYKFSKTRRPVENHVTSVLVFRDGLIVRHTDTFDFWAWSRMALGLPGLLLGWTPILRHAVRKEARGKLDSYLARRQVEFTTS